MTAEIAIMNRSAVALAADSAVTVAGPRGGKIFNTANKLFALSKHHPVGLLVYGGADLLSVPWAVIVKEFRASLGSGSRASLGDYGDALVEYLTSNRRYFPEERQDRAVHSRFAGLLLGIRDETDHRVERHFHDHGPATQQVVRNILARVLQLAVDGLEEQVTFANAPEDFLASQGDRYGDLGRQVAADVLGDYPVDDELEEQVERLLALSLERPLGDASGLVIAGYGDEDVFPKLVEYRFEGVWGDVPLHTLGTSSQIDFDNPSAIVPFAQSEMVHLFMEGIEPSYSDFLDNVFRGALREVVDRAVDRSEGGLAGPEFDTDIDELVAALSEQAFQYRFSHHVEPIIDSVAYLPLDELAEMAEALVNLTSFKRRVAITQAETVGGAVDVAVISKVDGLIWINRKHYFESELNQHFFATYYDDTMRTDGAQL